MPASFSRCSRCSRSFASFTFSATGFEVRPNSCARQMPATTTISTIQSHFFAVGGTGFLRAASASASPMCEGEEDAGRGFAMGREIVRERRRRGRGATRRVLGRVVAMELLLETAGESHGPRLTAILSGMPAGVAVDAAAVDAMLAARRRGYGRSARQKVEEDRVRFTAGLRDGRTT